MQIWDDIKRSFKTGDITTRIIYVNVAVFIVARLLIVFINIFNINTDGRELILDWLAVPSYSPQLIVRPWTVITYQFLHLDFIHIAINMLWLFWFGRLFLNYFSRRQFLSVFFWGGLWGAIFYLLSFNFIPFFQKSAFSGQMLGASASILAIVVATATASPNQKIRLALIGEVRMKYLALAAVLIDLMSLTYNNSGGHIAHLGGAFAGYWFATVYFNNNKDITKWIASIIDFFSTYTFKRKPKMKARKTSQKFSADKKSDMDYNKHKKDQQVEIDTILEKIKKSGYSSLTKSEKEALFKASK